MSTISVWLRRVLGICIAGSVCVISLDARSFSVGRHFTIIRNNGESLYSILGWKWGYKGDQSLSTKAIEQRLALHTQEREAKKTEKQAQREERQEQVKVARATKQQQVRVDTDETYYTQVDNRPVFMVYREERSYLWGMMKTQHKERYAVTWDDTSEQPCLQVNNNTNEPLFVDVKQGTFFGVDAGTSRRVAYPHYGNMCIWRRQRDYESRERLLTAVRIPDSGVREVTVTPEKDTIRARVLT